MTKSILNKPNAEPGTAKLPEKGFVMKRWFEKYIGCAFYVYGKERVFVGTCENPETKTGKPLQYTFEPENVVVDYKEARAIMGAMIDKYSR